MNGSNSLLLGVEDWGILVQVFGDTNQVPRGTMEESRIIPTGGSFLYPLPRLASEKAEFLLPEGIKKAPERKLIVKGFESGGGFNHSGRATVIAGCHGERMTRFFPTEEERNQGAHARFTLEKMVSVTAKRKKDNTFFLSIKKHFAKSVNGNGSFRVETELMWEGRPEEFPEDKCFGPVRLSEFKNAIEAAMVKADCFHCNHVHFARR